MPPKGRRPQPKKPKLARAEQTVTQTAIDKLAALDLTFSSVPPALASDLLVPLKPGWGLLGTVEEEEEYYAWYVQNITSDQVSAPRSKDTTMINLTAKNQRATDQEIGGADSDDAQLDEPSDDEENEEQDEPILEAYKHKDKKKTAAGEESDGEIALGDYEKLHFGRDFIDVDGERIHATEYFGTKWTQRIVSLACATSHIPGYLVLTYT